MSETIFDVSHLKDRDTAAVVSKIGDVVEAAGIQANGHINSATLSGTTTLPGSGQIDSSGRVGIGVAANSNYNLIVLRSDNPAIRVERDTDTDTAHEVFSVTRSRSSTTPPGAGFGGAIAYNLEGFTDGLKPTAGTTRVLWQNAQTDDTTSRNGVFSIQLIAAGSIGEKLRILSDGKTGIGGSFSTNAPQALLHVGSTAATVRSYNSFTDASNGSWAYLGDWGKTANVATYGTDQNGTGTARGMQLMTGGTVALQINTSQLLVFGPSAAFTSSFPALKRSSTEFQHRLGDDTAFAPVAASALAQAAGENANRLELKSLTELTTIEAAATTDTAIQIPANALVIGVSVRVTTVIPTAATFDYGVSGATTRYGTGISTAATTTSPGTIDAVRYYSAATAIRITPDLTPADNSGRVRVTIHYILITPPTS